MNYLRNSVSLIGNLGKDVDFKELESGTTLARVSLATKDVYKNQKGEKVVETQWHNLIGWDKIAQRMQVFLKKGKQIAVSGKLIHRTYQDKEGTTKYRSEIIVRDFMLLG